MRYFPEAQSDQEGTSLILDLERNAVRKVIKTKQGHSIEYREFSVARSKAIIDQIDMALARLYGFTDYQLDFILNYDIKYRMGRDAQAEDAE